jgi:photosystem II stability/assembly factor-like uncharacterized protein
MNNRSVLLIAYFVLLGQTLAGQTIEILADNLNTSMRGLSVVNDRVVWASGSKGTVGVTTDGGRTWTWQTVNGFETRDFRDIEAFDEHTAVIMAIAEPAVILRTTDAGVTWKVVYENKTAGMFLDAMDFVDNQHGTVVGDPVNGRFFIAHTQDGGLTWKEAAAESLPEADSGEACFAASGTNLRLAGGGMYYLVSGGKRSRLFVHGKPQALPVLQGKQSTGANSFAYYTNKKSKTTTWIVTGGDFSADTLRAGNCAISHDQGKTWKAPAIPPAGYRSCVEFISASKLIACGTSGIDFSQDGGLTWNKISPEGFHVCRKARKGTAVFLAGKGRIARLIP